MARTFFAEMTRLDEVKTPVTVEYSFQGGSETTYSPRFGADGGDAAEVLIVRAWLKADENDAAAPYIQPTDAEMEAWSDHLYATHIDEFDEDDYL